jgi:hypothetical protein
MSRSQRCVFSVVHSIPCVQDCRVGETAIYYFFVCFASDEAGAAQAARGDISPLCQTLAEVKKPWTASASSNAAIQSNGQIVGVKR